MRIVTIAAIRRLALALALGGIAAGALAAADDAAPAAQGETGDPASASAPSEPNGPMGPGEHGYRGPGGPGHEQGDRPGWQRWQHGPMGRHGFAGRMGGHGRHRGMMMDRGLLMAFRQLDLNPVQREQVRTILFNAREAVRMRRANEQQSGAAERARQEFAVLSNPGDPNYAHAVQQLKSRAAERVQQAIQQASDTEQKLYNVLTAEQKAQLPKVLSDLRSQREQRRHRMAERRSALGAPQPSPPSPPEQ